MGTVLNPAYVERLKSLINASPFLEHNSITVGDFGLGYSVLDVTLQTKHLQAYGVVHGGFLATVIDVAAFWAVYCDLDSDSKGLISVDLKLNFLGAAREGTIHARGTRIKLGATLGYGMAEVKDDTGRLLAHGTSTLMVMPQSLFKATDIPPKFID